MQPVDTSNNNNALAKWIFGVLGTLGTAVVIFLVTNLASQIGENSKLISTNNLLVVRLQERVDFITSEQLPSLRRQITAIESDRITVSEALQSIYSRLLFLEFEIRKDSAYSPPPSTPKNKPPLNTP